jgi:glycosyltransferase involved in cell wall biosynthesis
MKPKKKLLFLITKSNWGGAQRYVYDLATTLSSEHYEIAVALGGDGELVKRLNDKNITVLHISSLQRDISLKKELMAFNEMRSIVKAYAPDILHVNSSKAGALGAFIGRLEHVPKIIFTAHAWAFNENRNILSRCIFMLVHWVTILLSHTTITVSNALRHQMRLPWAQSKLVTIHNGVAPIIFLEKADARTRITKSQQPETFWTGTIAELHPIKGHDITLRALKVCIDSGHRIHHTIIGGGELEQELKALTKDLGLERNVTFTGPLQDAAQLLKAFDLFILSSRSEALGFVLIEAAQAGLSVIASKVGGIPEIITHNKNGSLVLKEDVSALAEEIQLLIHSPDQRERYAENIKETAAQFSLPHMIRETEKVYR